MADYPIADFLVVTATCLGVVVALMGLTAVLAQLTGRVSVVDVIWGLGFIAMTVTAILASEVVANASASGDHNERLWFLIVMVSIWGGRLAWHIARRSHGGGEDPRYEELMGDGGFGVLLKKVLLPQGLAIWFVSLPIQVTVLSGDHYAPLVYLGIAVWAIGLAFESIGDRQLAAYKRDPQRAPVMDRGLWRYTRHPNYFGDACVWWGIFLLCASSWPGVLTILSPVAMTYFLLFATGARLLERTMMQRPGYPEYAERTSMFFPLPPKKS